MWIIQNDLSIGLGTFATNLFLNLDNHNKVTIDCNSTIGAEMMTLGGYCKCDDWDAMPCQNITQLCHMRILIPEEIRHHSHQFQDEIVVLRNQLMVVAIVEELTKDRMK